MKSRTDNKVKLGRWGILLSVLLFPSCYTSPNLFNVEPQTSSSKEIDITVKSVTETTIPVKLQNLNIIVYSGTVFEKIAPHFIKNLSDQLSANKVLFDYAQYDKWEDDDKYKLSNIIESSRTENYEYVLVIFDMETEQRTEIKNYANGFNDPSTFSSKNITDSKLAGFLYSTSDSNELWKAQIEIEGIQKSTLFSENFLKKMGDNISISLLAQLKKDDFFSSDFVIQN